MKSIPLTRGKFALVDDADFDWLMQWKWYSNAAGYAVKNEARVYNKDGLIIRKSTLMHRLILNPPDGMITDHRDGNRINNQRVNLRNATHLQNSRNKNPQKRGSSKFKGVCWHKASGKWDARIRVNKSLIHLGLFRSERAAANAYNKAARIYFSDFAKENFL